MGKVKKMISLLFSINILTIYLNFKYLKFADAIKFPILVFGRVSVHFLKGIIKINAPIKTGMIVFGTKTVGIFSKRLDTVFNILGTVEFNGKASFGRGSSLSVGKQSTLSFGDNFAITANSTIVASGGKNVTFGDDCLLSWEILVMNTDFHKIYQEETKELVNAPRDITVKNHVWIGCGAKLLKGTVIPANSIIAAGSVISGVFSEEGAVYGNGRGSKLKGNINWAV